MSTNILLEIAVIAFIVYNVIGVVALFHNLDHAAFDDIPQTYKKVIFLFLHGPLALTIVALGLLVGGLVCVWAEFIAPWFKK